MDFTRTRSTTHIHIRSSMSGHWQWELVTADGHIASESEKFTDRQDCEADALKQGLPLTGLARRRNTKSGIKASAGRGTIAGWTVSRDGLDLWTWKRAATSRDPGASSSRAFLSEDECLADAAKHGYTLPVATGAAK